MKIIAKFLRQDILEMSKHAKFDAMLGMLISDSHNRTEGC
jgi:hypothetical protein